MEVRREQYILVNIINILLYICSKLYELTYKSNKYHLGSQGRKFPGGGNREAGHWHVNSVKGKQSQTLVTAAKHFIL